MKGRAMQFTVQTFTMPGGTLGYRVMSGRPGPEFDALADALAQLSHDIAAMWAAIDAAQVCEAGHRECAVNVGGPCLDGRR